MDNMSFATEYVNEELEKCESVDELIEVIFPLIKSQKKTWKKAINQIIGDTKLSQGQFAELCGVSRQTVNGWCQGKIPKSREHFIRIGLAAHMNIDEINRLLTKHGRYTKLYDKDLNDCICRFVLTHDLEGEPVHLYEEIKERITSFEKRSGFNQGFANDTQYYSEKLGRGKTVDELESFVKEHSEAFSSSYRRFCTFIKMVLEDNEFLKDNVLMDMAISQGWSPSLQKFTHAICDLNQRDNLIITRNKVISLCIHIGFELDTINEVLEMAHFAPLYAKNIFESIIIYVVSSRDINRDENDYVNPDELGEYTNYAIQELLKIKDRIKRINDDVDLSELEDFLSEVLAMELNDSEDVPTWLRISQ